MQFPKLSMRQAILSLLLVCGLTIKLSVAQTEDSATLFRSAKPLACKVGFEGVGIDLALGKSVALGATSFIYYNAAKARILLLPKNGTPFVGIGIGGAGGPGGGGKNWTVLLGGWEHDYERLFFQFIVQVTIHKSASYERSVFPVSFEIGWRI